MLIHNPPHPGKVLREYLGEMDISEATVRLKAFRPTMSRIRNRRAGISAEMSLRQADALAIHPAFG